MAYYFAYGSNLSQDRLEEQRLKPEGVALTSRRLARLDGYALVFDKPSAYFIGAGAGNIKPAPSGTIYGSLNEMPEKGLLILDKYENVASGQYKRLNVSVYDVENDAMVNAVTYIAHKNLSADLKPRSGYMDFLLEGSDLLPAEYVAHLKTIPLCPEVAE